ncbi:hypothetical protein [Pedosphaera parvula]|uniref:Uncharacterized protein n=1 Tax=Pedosphaera parvula (strain Ellin514) TaxID=320771 RepID=B9XKE3_PEDPL|nr:hypothetical protein [Pedosphaera parvula]EEF59613.1 hypothetical protein Cflav_PD2602 [Pedosphaera parvula Ellin514]
MKLNRLSFVCVIISISLVKSALAEDAYYRMRWSEIQFTEGELPKNVPFSISYQAWNQSEAMEPYATLDGQGEVFLAGYETLNRWTKPSEIYNQGFLNVCGPKDQLISGHLYLPKPDQRGMVSLAFKVTPSATTSEARQEFLKAKQSHYHRLLQRDVPGAAWFRHQQLEASKALKVSPDATSVRPTRFNRRSDFEPDDTYALFTGGRAISENLQLDRLLIETKPGELAVDLTNITGITVQEMDWKPLIKDVKIECDPLAASIPADQHALFFPSFTAMTQVMDEADAHGTPLLQMFESRSIDTDSRGRYEKQLCLGLNELSRRFGPQVIRSIAFTGSDPYLRTGTDIGIVFEATQPEMLKTFLLARQGAVVQGDIKPVRGEILEASYSGVVSPDRSICSYVASVGNVVFVSNSQYQLGRLIETTKGKRASLGSQDEYLFFRNRYPRGDKKESAFLVLSDATIRRWCSPQWRIATARRTRALAGMTEAQATSLDALVKGTVKPGKVETSLTTADSEGLTVNSQGVLSSTYGTLSFQTPIAEMPMTRVTQAEADAYKRWRDTYQQNWSQYFDPIAVRLSVSPERIGAEVTVMPLITRSDYAELVRLSSGASIPPGAGDPHSGTLAHLVMALNPQSEPVVRASSFVGTMAPNIKANPLGWLGHAVSLYADEDPFWEELAQSEKPEDFLEHEYHQLPVALHCDVKNPLGLAAFLTALHAYADQSAPGMTLWENREYNGQTYVKITPSKSMREENELDKLAVYYAVTPKSLVLTLNESVLKRAVDRQAARSSTNAVATASEAAIAPWLGTNLCLQVQQHFLKTLEGAAREEYQIKMQNLAWSNLPILNEWKHRFPNEDPVKLHEQFWQTKLICPAGGSYVWNEKWQTMESTVYGHPGEPKRGPSEIGPFAAITSANLGLSFETNGLSAKAVLNRTTGKR